MLTTRDGRVPVWIIPRTEHVVITRSPLPQQETAGRGSGIWSGSGQMVHVIWDNLNTHINRERWASFNARDGGRFVFHFTPKHASWVNQIELWFGIFAKRSL